MKDARTFKPTGSSDATFYRLFDMFSLFLAFQCASLFYYFELNVYYVISILTVALTYLYSAEIFSVYRSWRAGKFINMILTASSSLLIAFTILFIVMFMFKFSGSLSRIGLGLWVIFSFIFLFTWRFLVRLYKRNRRRLGMNLRNVAIIGATESAISLYNEIEANDELGFNFLGIFDDRNKERLFDDVQSHNIKGTVESAIEAAQNGEIDILYIALPMKAQKRIAEILLELGNTTVDVHIIPDFLMSNLIHARVEHVGNVDTLSVFESPFFGAHEFIKRTEDVVVASIILVLISPLLITIACLVKFTSKGPVIFKQDRYGLDGRKIKVWKFRSMSVTENSEVVTQATKNDARITPLGGFLRRTSLDELPQFINVLKGDMSIVGPRPHAVAHNEEYRKKVEFYMLRHKAKPGITGWAQINGWRGETDTIDKMEKRVEFDLYYIKHWSLWLDVKIIFLTIFKGFRNANAY